MSFLPKVFTTTHLNLYGKKLKQKRNAIHEPTEHIQGNKWQILRIFKNLVMIIIFL